MKKQQTTFILILTIVVALAIAFLVGTTITGINARVEEACFGRLAATSRRLARELNNTVQMDKTTLSAMAALINSEENVSDARLCEIMRTYKFDGSFISYLEIMKPDNTMLSMDGTIRKVSDSHSFAIEAGRGPHVAGILGSKGLRELNAMHNAVPVVRRGRTIYILYGVVRLDDFAQKYTTTIYDGKAFVFLVDGNTGDFLLDTWHKMPESVHSISEREMLPGFSSEGVMADLRSGKEGRTGFVSKSIGKMIYLGYAPVGVNNWSVLVMTSQDEALADSLNVSSQLYWMAGLIAVILLVYMACVVFCMLRAYREVCKLGGEDQVTELQNRNAFEQFFNKSQEKKFDLITCVYADLNGLHEHNNLYGHKSGDEMLRRVAEELRGEFAWRELYRVGGDEFVVLTDHLDYENCLQKMKAVQGRLATFEYNLAVGIVCRMNEQGVGRVVQEADEKMLENKRTFYEDRDRRQR